MLYFLHLINLESARGRTRTGTSLRTGDFKSTVSTISPLGLQREATETSPNNPVV